MILLVPTGRSRTMLICVMRFAGLHARGQMGRSWANRRLTAVLKTINMCTLLTSATTPRKRGQYHPSSQCWHDLTLTRKQVLERCESGFDRGSRRGFNQHTASQPLIPSAFSESIAFALHEHLAVAPIVPAAAATAATASTTALLTPALATAAAALTAALLAAALAGQPSKSVSQSVSK